MRDEGEVGVYTCRTPCLTSCDSFNHWRASPQGYWDEEGDMGGMGLSLGHVYTHCI